MSSGPVAPEVIFDMERWWARVDGYSKQSASSSSSSSNAQTPFKDGLHQHQPPKKLPLLHETSVRLLCLKVKDMLRKEANVRHLRTPVTVVGDVHGQVYDVLELFKIGGEAPVSNYLFLGDYVDRGHSSVETITILTYLKLKWPDRVTLLRGNHETRQITQVYGFYLECQRKYAAAATSSTSSTDAFGFPVDNTKNGGKNAGTAGGGGSGGSLLFGTSKNATSSTQQSAPDKDATAVGVKVWQYFTDMFDYLPICATIDDEFFATHGGLSPSILALDQIRVLDRFGEIPHDGPLADLMWSDPDQEKVGFTVSPRGAGYIFGADVCEKFLHYNGMQHIVRAHQLCMQGYQVLFDEKLSTVWSAPNYCYRFGNTASLLELNSDGAAAAYSSGSSAAGAASSAAPQPLNRMSTSPDAAQANTFLNGKGFFNVFSSSNSCPDAAQKRGAAGGPGGSSFGSCGTTTIEKEMALLEKECLVKSVRVQTQKWKRDLELREMAELAEEARRAEREAQARLQLEKELERERIVLERERKEKADRLLEYERAREEVRQARREAAAASGVVVEDLGYRRSPSEKSLIEQLVRRDLDSDSDEDEDPEVVDPETAEMVKWLDVESEASEDAPEKSGEAGSGTSSSTSTSSSRGPTGSKKTRPTRTAAARPADREPEQEDGAEQADLDAEDAPPGRDPDHEQHQLLHPLPIPSAAAGAQPPLPPYPRHFWDREEEEAEGAASGTRRVRGESDERYFC